MERIYRPREVAKICNVTTPTIHNWIEKGVLKAISLPYGRKRISHESLNAFLEVTGMPKVESTIIV